jgi:hypothetical protein
MEFDLNVPGAFVEHGPLQPTLTRTTALSHASSSSIFRTPQSPSAASSLSRSFRAARPGSELGTYTGSRKRQRLDLNTAAMPESRGYFSHSNYDMLNTPVEAESPAPLVNIDYKLAGGSDTLRASEDQESDLDQDYRMSRFTVASPMRNYDYNPRTPAPLVWEVNGRKHGYGLQESPKGWDIPRTVWALTGGAALKIASFAWSTGKAFTGFRAGGGAAYTYSHGGFADQSWMAVEEEKEQDPFDAAFQGRRDRTGTPIPGQFPECDSGGSGGIDARYIDDYMANPAAHQRRNDVNLDVQTPTLQWQGTETTSNSTLKSKNRESWVIVQPQDTRDASPTRRHKKPTSTASLGYSRPVSRASPASISIGPRPKLQPRSSVTSASYASPRAGGMSSAPLEDTTNTYSPGHRRNRSSLASPRRESAINANMNQNQNVNVSPDVLLYSRKLRSKEKKIDNSMRRLNSQLEEMIREGKEALGTKIEVRDTYSAAYETDEVDTADRDMDEGYAGSDGLRY